MVQTFFSVSIPKFLSVKHKTSKIIYTELSYGIKLISSIAIVALYRPMNISSIIFFMFFLLLISHKIYASKYISYKQFSANVIIIKFTFLVVVFMLSNKKESITVVNNILFSSSPNILVELNKNNKSLQEIKIKALIENIRESCLRSIYKIEIASLVSIIISKLLVFSIQPKTLLHLLKKTWIPTSINSDINLVFTFSSQIHVLISEQMKQLIITLKGRSSDHTVKHFFYQNKIFNLLFSYSIRKKYNLKKEIMMSAQLNSSKLTKAQYSNLTIQKMLFFSNKLLIMLIAFIICFLIST